MAVRLLSSPAGKWPVQNRQDDVESFYHLLNYLATRHAEHTLRGSALARFFYYNFEQYTELKEIYLRVAHPSQFILNRCLRDLLQLLAETLYTRYLEALGTSDDPEDKVLAEISDRGQEQLADSEWLVTKLTEALERTGWEECGGFVDREDDLWPRTSALQDERAEKRPSSTSSPRLNKATKRR